MTHVDLSSALDAARRLADEAGALALDAFRRGGAVHKKGAIDLLTDTDLAVEALVRARLGEAFPEHDLVGEEGKDLVRGDRPVWYVDPIDGTTNFAHGHPFFSVSLGLFAEGRAVLGVVAAPALGVTWSGAEGLGAARRWRHADGMREEPCRVSSAATLADALCATGFPYDRWTQEDDNTREHRAFLKRAQGIRRCGSAAIDLCLVADGTYDLYWEQRLSPWDMCAGAALVSASGGRLSDYDGGPADPRTGRLVASNGLVHDAALEVLAGCRAP